MISKHQLDSRDKNIDNIVDALMKAQQDAGLETHMREVIFDPSTNERINRFQRARLEREGVDLSVYGNVHSGCSGCGKCGEKPISNIERGIFVYDENDLLDDSDELYICEMCMSVGFDQKYRPEVCDSCEECLSCSDYLRGDCDGCGYSTVYNGGRYGTVQNVAVERNEEDERLLAEIDNDLDDSKVHYPSGHFTIMDY